MSEPGFLSRWSRRKASAVRERAVPVEESSLPDVATLGVGSDYTGFLQAGVSRALQVRALGVAWASDPAIAGFRGMAEYDWDFNVAGYGRLRVGDDVGALLRAIMAPVMREAPSGEVGEPEVVRVPEARVAVLAQEPVVEELAAVEVPEAEVVVVRRHGGALPA